MKALLPAVILLSACAAPLAPDAHVPPFARVPFEPISRETVVAIALREWRLFGSPVDDDQSSAYRPASPEDKPERQQGLWQRVGEYWWLAMNAGTRESAWTGKRNENGAVFPANADGRYAWSAAFVSYVMRMAGAGPRFPYSSSHSVYIDMAKQMALGQTTGWLIRAERPEDYAPQPGDLVCFGRGSAGDLRYDDLPAGLFPGHCDIVVDTTVPLQISVVGGNIDDAVTLEHVPVTADGRLATPDGQIVDGRHHWMTVLQLLLSVPVAWTQYDLATNAKPLLHAMLTMRKPVRSAMSASSCGTFGACPSCQLSCGSMSSMT
jgi:hypothetical protein